MAKIASPSVSIPVPFVARTDAQVLLGLSPLDSADTQQDVKSSVSADLICFRMCTYEKIGGSGQRID